MVKGATGLKEVSSFMGDYDRLYMSSRTSGDHGPGGHRKIDVSNSSSDKSATSNPSSSSALSLSAKEEYEKEGNMVLGLRLELGYDRLTVQFYVKL
jgi:hypothetical protein